jgi:hypothetical protein
LRPCGGVVGVLCCVCGGSIGGSIYLMLKWRLAMFLPQVYVDIDRINFFGATNPRTRKIN